jgi:Trk-type K+ transport system membrane component
LVFVGAAVFFIAENGNTLGKQDFSEAITTSFFQSVTARTAGFNTVSFSNLTPIVIVATMILMFIGASSGSTGGGIKTSTFTVLLLAIVKRKEKAIDYGTSFLTGVLVKKAVTILLYSFGVIVVSIIILIIVEPDKAFTQLCFEEISAFGTVGLSTGITHELSHIGKSVIMASMFIGRIGPLALAYALIRNIHVSKQKTEQGIMIG